MKLPWIRPCAAIAAMALAVFAATPAAHAQLGFGFNNGLVSRAVGGVSIDPEGVLAAPTVDEQRRLESLRRELDLGAPEDLQKFAELRPVSLKEMEAAIAAAAAANKPVPVEVALLHGLQRIKYVFVYPERNDVVLVGPAEGWLLDGHGNFVGGTTGRPVLLLDDLMVALRGGASSRVEAITCSIDPTPEGNRAFREVVSQLTTMGDRKQTLRTLEDALGPQVISVTGVPATSHFARSLVAADFRMKRIAMNFEPSPIGQLPSFLKMMGRSAAGMSSMMPRWWLAPNYEPLAKSPDGLAWEIRGHGVKCLTEEDYADASGQVQHTGKSSPLAQQWADLMTRNFDELASHDSAFGQLRNVIDLAVLGALVEREQLFARAGLQAPLLSERATVAEFSAPRTTASQASAVKHGRTWVISASGGVEILPWSIVERTEDAAELSAIRERLAAAR